MMPSLDLFATYNKAEALLNAGDLRQSADLCQQILNANPQFPHGHHLMSCLFRSTGAFEQALQFARSAIELDPTLSMFHVQLGQVFFGLGKWNESAEAFGRAFDLDPRNPFPLILQADAYTQQSAFVQARALFRKARRLSDIPEIDEHEGLCCLGEGDAEGAERLFDRVIARRPDYAYGHIHKGKMLLARRAMVEAEASFARALKVSPREFEALHHMAVLYEAQGALEMALGYCVQAVNVNPSALQALILLGMLLLRQNNPAGAEQVFKQALQLAPENIYILHGLANALMPQKKLQEALPYVEKALTVRPDNKTLRHFRSILRGETVETPKIYVQELFDFYADSFDHHLQQRLAYKTPTLVANAIRALPQMQGRSDLSLLDLGCGTGLSAEALRDITKVRIGVDLSQKMLDKARAKQLYDQLYALDVVEYAIGCDRQFDLVTAMDVLVYIGDLEPLFQAVRNALSADGILALTVERENGSELFRLNETGRYTHRFDYVRSVAQKQGYTLLHEEEATIRLQSDEPVTGGIFLFKKSQTH